MSVLNAAKLRQLEPQILCIGSHPGIIQSILDFDYLLGRPQSSIVGIIATGRRSERYFYGKSEVLIPVYAAAADVPPTTLDCANLFINLTSGRRVLASTKELLAVAPHIIGGTIFAERLPERHALELYEISRQRQLWIAGGSSVGVMVPGALKLGAIGGVDARQVEASNLFQAGQIAVVSTSGGMVNEIIRTVAVAGPGVSFAVAIGGERFPVMTLEDVFLSAEADPQTKAVAYFGELGGDDEYHLAELITAGKITKPIVAYIAGAVSDVFETPPQFGHAKAMAAAVSESAEAKAQALRAVGASVGKTYSAFVAAIQKLPYEKLPMRQLNAGSLVDRKKGLFSSSISYDKHDEVQVLGQDLLQLAAAHSFAYIAGSMLLGRPLRSKKTEAFIDYTLKILVDHGPYVSGAVNTIITARAGRDMVSSLAAGLLTVGPRFGGAINQAATTWIRGVKEQATAEQFVEAFAARKQYISGIGHRKYRADLPDPRVTALLDFAKDLKDAQFTTFARSIETVTVSKKANLILNVDGAIAAVLLDLLFEEEGYSIARLEQLAEQEFFNSLFVLSRTVGFMAHYYDQVRLDEGLFRLGTDDVTPVTDSY